MHVMHSARAVLSSLGRLSRSHRLEYLLCCDVCSGCFVYYDYLRQEHLLGIFVLGVAKRGRWIFSKEESRLADVAPSGVVGGGHL